MSKNKMNKKKKNNKLEFPNLFMKKIKSYIQ